MKIPEKRPFTRSGEYIFKDKKGRITAIYSKYNSLDQAVQDFIYYLDYVDFPTRFNSIEQFVENLYRREYFTDSKQNYLNGVRNWFGK